MFVTRRQFLARSVATGGMLVAAPAVLTACAGVEDAPEDVSDAEAGPPRSGGTLTMARAADPLGVDPVEIGDNESIWMVSNLYERLYQSSNTGELVPWLATGHTLSEDRLSWSFSLRAGVKFSDGTAMTAQDVKFSIDRCTESEATGYQNAAIESVDVADDHTVVVHTKYPTEMLGVISFFANGILPKDFGDRGKEEFFEQPVGTGPFHLTSRQVGRSVVLSRNEHYWQQGKPYLDEVELTAVSNTSTRSVQLRGRQAEIIESPEWSHVEPLKAEGGIEVQSYPSTILYFLLLNTTQAELADPHVRKAISLGIDRDAIVRVALFNGGQTAGSMFSPTWPGYDKSLVAPSYDVSAAGDALAQSKYADGFTLTYSIDGGDSVQATVAQLIQSNLKELGIAVTIDQYDPNTLWEMVEDHQFGVVHRKLSLDIMDSRANVPFLVDPSVDGYATFAGYDNADVVALSQKVARTTGASTSANIFKKIQQALSTDLPYVPLYYLPWSYAMSSRVRGFDVPPTGDYHLENTWLTS